MSGDGDVRVRDARPEERDEIERLTRAAYEQYAERMAPEAWRGLRAAMVAGLATEEPVERIVAERDGRLVGSVLLFAPASDAYRGAVEPSGAPELRLLAVLPEARGSGVGKALVQECVRRARKAGARELGLHTSRSMEVAIGLYERMGFERAPELDFQPDGAERVTAYRLPLGAEEPPGRA
jgi:ribosomal protein S18 acetylase RimI-like enzyme